MMSEELSDNCYPAREEAQLKMWADLCCTLQIVVFNLPWKADAETLARDFADCGHVEKAEMQHDQDGRSKVRMGLRCLLLDVHLARLTHQVASQYTRTGAIGEPMLRVLQIGRFWEACCLLIHVGTLSAQVAPSQGPLVWAPLLAAYS